MKHLIHSWLRATFFHRVAKAIYAEMPLVDMSYDKFNEQQQLGNPAAEVHMNRINRLTTAAIAALVWRKS